MTRRDSSPHDRLHIICERDVGLFSLFQQVVATIPWAVRDGRIPIVNFGSNCIYWTSNGYAGRKSVWEYYFDPLVPDHGAATIPSNILKEIEANPPAPDEEYRALSGDSVATSTFGDIPSMKFRGPMLTIPYEWRDPPRQLRNITHLIIKEFIRPRDYITQKVDNFFEKNLFGTFAIGIHARGTDALKDDTKDYRRGSLILCNYVRVIEELLKKEPASKLLIATDEQDILDYFTRLYGNTVVAYETIRHKRGEKLASTGPWGWSMPAYIAGDCDVAARNGEEAVIEFLLLRKCGYLLHNGSSLARTVLLAEPEMPYKNVHLCNLPLLNRWRSTSSEFLRDFLLRIGRR
jgi:hypothetical protein